MVVWAPKIRFFGISQKWVEGKLKRLFFIFYQIFVVFDDFSKFCSTFDLLHNEKSSNIWQWQKMKKSLVQLAFNPYISTWYYGYPKFGFRVTIPPLITITILWDNFFLKKRGCSYVEGFFHIPKFFCISYENITYLMM